MSSSIENASNRDRLFGAIADILAATVLIDKREKDIELIEFTHCAMFLSQELQPGEILTRRMCMEIFQACKARLNDKLHNDHDNAFKMELLEKITDKDLQRHLLSSIFSIAVCDYELHDEESGFIKTALKVWNREMPTVNDLDAIA